MGHHMAIAFAVGDRLVTPEDLDRAARDATLASFKSDAAFNGEYKLKINEDLALSANDLKATWDAISPSVPFQGIGVGKPLTIVLEQVYLGNYPDAMPRIPGQQRGDVLVTSANKAFQTFEAAPRAIHMMQERAARKSRLRATASRQGSQLVFYAPAVTDDSIIFTFEIVVDRDFDDKLGNSLSQAFKTAGALPVFAPAAPYLVAAGVAIPLATEAANLLARPRPCFEATMELNFARPGMQTIQAGATLIYPDGYESEFSNYTMSRDDHSLRDRDGKRYAGDVAYMVVSLDGTDQPEYEKWTAQAASASITERFFGGGGSMTKALELVTDSLSLYNDLAYQKLALGIKRSLLGASEVEKDRLSILYEAYKKNIQNEEIRKTLK